MFIEIWHRTSSVAVPCPFHYPYGVYAELLYFGGRLGHVINIDRQSQRSRRLLCIVLKANFLLRLYRNAAFLDWQRMIDRGYWRQYANLQKLLVERLSSEHKHREAQILSDQVKFNCSPMNHTRNYRVGG